MSINRRQYYPNSATPIPSLKIRKIKQRLHLAQTTALEYKIPILFIIAHIPLGILLYNSKLLAFLHPVLVLIVGLHYAIKRQAGLEKVSYVLAYLIGSEVLWRMAKSPVFWEFGKYAATFIMLTALLRRQCWRIPVFPLIYILLLMPACILTFITNDFGSFREKVSFNMSGPFLLFTSCWFFFNVKLSPDQVKKLLLTICIPIISIGIATLFYTISTENIQFNDESNAATSGGYGPNQVSTILGLGAFAAMTGYLLFKNDLKNTVYLGILLVFFSAQSVMTFSRSGMYNALAAATVIIFVKLINLQFDVKKMIPIFGALFLFLMFVFPFLNDFTGGKLQERFEDTGTTNRAEIAQSEFELFLQNPILGTGVGEAKTLRSEILGTSPASHTEFTRVISEHGLLGILGMLAVAIGTVSAYQRKGSVLSKAFMCGVVIWSVMYMLNSGMRLAAPSFMLGISYVFIAAMALKRKRPISKAFKGI